MSIKHLSKTFLLISSVSLLGFGAEDKAMMNSTKNMKDKPMTGMSDNMSMMDMMGKSNMNCMATSDSLDQLLKIIQTAKSSGDKQKMVSALTAAETHIAEMKNNMNQCMKMMGQMEKMTDKKPSVSPPANKDLPADHEKHHPK